MSQARTTIETAEDEFRKGLSFARDGRLDDAIPFLVRSVELFPNRGSLRTLAKAFIAAEQYEKALDCITTLELKGWGDVKTLRWKCEVQSKMGLISDSVQTYREILDAAPLDVIALRRYCDLVWPTDPDDVAGRLGAWSAVATEDTPHLLLGLHHVMHYRGRWERKRSGRSSILAESIEDLFGAGAPADRDRLLTATQKQLERNPGDAEALAMLGFHAVGQQDWEAVAQITRQLHDIDPSDPNIEMWIDDACAARLDRMTDEDIAGPFMPVQHYITLPPSDQGTLFVSSDFSYFLKFTAPLLLSLDDLGVSGRVRVHIMNVEQDQLKTVQPVVDCFSNIQCGVSYECNGFSAQTTQENRLYYAAIRYIRLYQAMAADAGPYWSVDPDGLINGNPARVYESLGKNDLGLSLVPDVWYSKSQVRGDFFAVGNTNCGRAFAKRVAARISDTYQRNKMYWCLDQNSLFTVYNDMRRRECAPDLHVFDESSYTLDAAPDSVYWSSAGKEKFEVLNKIILGEGTDLGGVSTPYNETFARHVRRLQDAFVRAGVTGS